MTARRAFLVPSLIVLSLSAGIARAQTPLGPPQVDLATLPGSATLESLALDGQGNVTLLWQEDPGRRTFVRRFSPTDAPLGAFQLSRYTNSPSAAANQRGATVMIWNQASQNGGDEVLVRRLHTGLPQLTVRADRGREALLRIADDVDVDRNGRFVAVWTEAGGAGGRLHAQRFNANGSYQGREITVTSPGVQLDSRVAMNPATGDFLLVWVSSILGEPERIFGQRFRFNTGPLGSAFQINTTLLGEHSFPDAACAADGSCVVVWRRYPSTDRPGDVLFQRFGPDGKRRGGETLVGKTPKFGGHGTVAVAPQGYFVVAWADANSSPSARFRLFREDGTPAGPEVPITATDFPSSPQLAFGWDGTFVVGWTDLLGHLNDHVWEINYQRFEVPPGL